MALEITVRAAAKINLLLEVTGKRPDGYHELVTVFQSIGLYDYITLQEVEEGIHVHCLHPGVPAGADNLAYRAARSLLFRRPGGKGVEIFIDKHIPIAGGLGGGSADAAAVLVGLNRLWGLNLPLEELLCTGAELGADVPFFILGGTAVGRGRGELLTPLPRSPGFWVVLANPGFPVSTAEVYASLDLARVRRHPDLGAMLRALESCDAREVASCLGNVLEEVTLARYPILRGIKERMLEAGALGTLMCGSGPTIFALAADEGQARRVAAAVAPLPGGVWVTSTLSAKEAAP